jgi:hypothetical protein
VKLKVYKEGYKILKLDKVISKSIEGVYFYAQTEDEISLVCKETIEVEHVTDIEKGYRLIKIEGILDFSLVGIISKISTLLANNNISIFVISTFNTDYFMVKEDCLQQTVTLLVENNYDIKK